MLISELGEEALLRQLRRLFAGTADGIPTGIGDDAAVIAESPGYHSVWSTDLLLEGVHFRKSWQTASQIGMKSLAVNVSDLSAMGAIPRYALLSMAMPADTEVDYILDLCRGFRDLALHEQVAVIGGDTTASVSGLALSVTVGGFVPEGKAILRSGAKPGDAILVTGFLGSAAGGLKLLESGAGERGGRDSQQPFAELIRAFLEPVSTVRCSQLAAASGAHAMTDLSDGLGSDLAHICQESGVGARVHISRLPLHEQLRQAAAQYGWDSLALALSGGEDYGLLITMPAKAAEAAAEIIAKETGCTVSVIGEVVAGEGINLVESDGAESPMVYQGFDHFRSP